MSAAIYSLCALTSIACCVMLTRAWLASRHRILFWSALCFAGLSLNNVILVLDKLLLQQVDLTEWRLAVGFAAILLLLIGLVWEEQ
jgi:hypothetical protein